MICTCSSAGMNFKEMIIHYHNSLFFSGLLCDLLWAEPDKEVMGWGEPLNEVSFTFGPEIVSKFLAKHDLDLIVRGNQVTGIRCCISA